jgi:predicted DNA-binding ribbon-helix-helix protein
MKSVVVKRSVVIAGHKTSVSLEDAFWKGLKEISEQQQISVSDIISNIDSNRQHRNLSSAIRLFVLEHARAQRSSASQKSKAGGGAPDDARDNDKKPPDDLTTT